MCQKIENELLVKVQDALEARFAGGVVEVDGNDMVHLKVKVESSAFKGVMLVEQHRMVLEALRELLDSDELHSVKIKTKAI